MPITVSHQLSATTPDDPAYEIRPSHWNSGHALTLALVGSEIVGALANANGLSFGLSAGSVTGSYTVPSQTIQTQNAVSVLGSTGNISFNNGNGITFGGNASTITASHNGLTTAAQSNHSHGNPTLNLTNLSGTTGSNSAGLTLSLSAASQSVQTQSTVAVLGSTGAISFQNSNGITFGGNASTVTASHNGLTTAAQSNHSHGNPTLALTNLSGTTASNSAGLTLSLSAAAPGGGGGAAISAGANSQNTGTVVFSNSNGISFGLAGGTLTASYTTPAGGGIAAAAGTQTGGTGTINFANSNGITFGMSGSSQITASHNGLTSQSNQAVSGQNGSSTFQTLSFGNSNGISFGTAAGGLTASHNALTTARASNDAIGLNTALTANGVAWTVNSSGLSLNIPAFLTTAALSNHSHGNPTLALTNLSGTTASNSAGLTLSLSAAAGGGGADGYNVLAAGTQTATTAGTVLFENSNGITFGMSASTRITASHNGITQQSTQPVAVSGQNGSYAFSTLSFSNANGMSFGTSAGSAITASYTVPTVPTAYVSSVNGSSGAISLNVGSSLSASTNGSSITFGLASNITTALQSAGAYLTTQSAQAASGQNGSSTFQTLSFGNSNGISFGTAAGGITASHNALTTARASNDAVGLNTALTANGVAWTVNSSGISLNVPAFLTTAALSNHSHGNPTLNLTNLSGTTASNSAGFTLSLSAAAPGGGAAVTASASNGSFTAGLLAFSNANNVTFGTSAGSIITASVAAPGAAAENNWVGLLGANTAGNTTASGSTIGYSGINLTLSGTNGSVVNISAPATSSIVGVNGVSLSTNGSTVSISGVPTYTMLTYNNRQLGASSNTVPGQNSVWLVPMRIAAPLHASTGLHMVSLTGTVTSNQTNTVGVTWEAALYKVTGTNLSRFDTIFSTSMGFTVWNSGTASVSYSYNVTSGSSAGSNLMTASVYGLRQLTFNIGSTLDPGLYAWGYRHSSSSAGNSSVLRSFNAVIDNPMPVAMGFMGSATNQSIGYVEGGTYATTSTAMPVSFEFSQIRQTNNAVPFIKMGAI